MIGPFPPYLRLQNFLPQKEHRGVLDWVLSNPTEFSEARVTDGLIGSDYKVSRDTRIALTSKNLGPFEPMLRKHLLDAQKDLAFLSSTPLSTQSLDLEFSAYGNGAFFAPHIDISTGKNRRPLSGEVGQDRILSAVYHFYSEPKMFSNGALRLYRFGANPEASDADAMNYMDLEPLNNSLIAFPSTALHEVRPIECQTSNFGNYRFALNCWYCRKL